MDRITVAYCSAPNRFERNSSQTITEKKMNMRKPVLFDAQKKRNDVISTNFNVRIKFFVCLCAFQRREEDKTRV